MSKNIGEVLSRFFWLLGQAFLVVDPFGAVIVAAVTVIIAALALWKFPKDTDSQKRLPLLLLLPAWWVFLALWGAYFAYHWDVGEAKNPAWAFWPVNATIFFFAFNWIVLLVYLRGARIITLLFGLWNAYFMAVMTLLAAMSVSGYWI